MPPKLRDVDDELVDRLDRLLRVMESKEFGSSQTDIDVTRTVNVDEPSDDNTSAYFSSGAQRLAVTNVDEWENLELGFVAQVINIRTTDTIEIAFANPNDGSGQPTTLRAAESPFSIGGAYGIGTAFVWIRQSPSASGTPEIEVIAYR